MRTMRSRLGECNNKRAASHPLAGWLADSWLIAGSVAPPVARTKQADDKNGWRVMREK